MRLSRLLAGVFIAAIACSAFASQPDSREALSVTRKVLDRAVSVGSEDLIPKQALHRAKVDEVVYIHDPVTLEPAYGLVMIHAADENLLGMLAIDAESGGWLWYTFSLMHDRFPPVSQRRAHAKVAARRRTLGLAGEVGMPVLVQGYDKHVYWRFEASASESWLVDAVLPEAPVLSSLDKSDREALSREELPVRMGNTGRDVPGGLSTDGDQDLLSNGRPAAYNMPGIPYHFQITSWYCGPSSLQMIMDYLGAEIGQHNIADVADDEVGSGCYRTDMRRAAHFSGMSVAIQDSSLEGYTERQLGYACMEAVFLTNQASRLKNTVYAQYPVFVLTWFDGGHTAGHYRVVKGYDDSLDVFIIHDPWYAGALCGPNLLINQSFFVNDLWDYSDHWCMVVSPWLLTPTVPSAVSEGDTFSVDLDVHYPGPTRFGDQYPCSDCEATISLSSGLALAGGSNTVSLPSLSSGDTASVSWDVVAVGPQGEWGMAFQAQGILEGSASSYPSYTDSIGGHAYETVLVTDGLIAGWDTEQRLTTDDASSQTCFPGGRAMVLSDDGTFHIVWAETRDDTGEIYYVSGIGGVWEDHCRLTEDANFSNCPCIAEGPDGRLHVAWVDTRDGNQEIYYKYWDTITGWSADERVTAYGEIDCNPSVAASDTAVYLAWERREGGSYRVASVRFSVRTDLGWSAPVDVDASPARDSYRPSLAVGGEGLVHLVYERQTSNTADEMERIVHKSWDGSIWSVRTGISTDVSFSRGPVVAAGSDSTVHVVWQDGENLSGDIFYAFYEGGSWQPTEQIVTGGTETSTPSVAVDGADDVYVAWVDHRHGDSEIYVMSKGGAGWGDETRLTEAGGASLVPTVAANAAGQVGVVWTDQRDGNAEVYFRGMIPAGLGPGPDVPVALRALYLSRPRPMPFTSETRIGFYLAEPSHISLEVFDVGGRLVRRLGGGSFGAGRHEAAWDGLSDLGEAAAPGVYFLRCSGPLGQDVRPIVLIR